MNHRGSVDNCNRYQNRNLDIIPGQIRRTPEFWSGGIRHRGGMTFVQALIWNLGSCRSDAKGAIQAETLQESEYQSGAQRRSHA